LSLKAFLVGHRVSEKKLKSSFGHNLTALLEAATSRGLSQHTTLSEEDVAEIGLANEYYAKKVFEYFAFEETVAGYPRKPALPLLGVIATKLVTDIRQFCYDASDDP
jgi:hypothetical protein